MACPIIFQIRKQMDFPKIADVACIFSAFFGCLDKIAID
jgi:hypothetical protein